ncbi:LacI family DNA-binding transcriptional regulator [Microbacterium sp. CFBP9034]|uniref:LacI family DNA-binding transcriptional regulator n=1 Tax=Microbacterium sp. CFBP9034 TaxID=3096540 RepID=UPI002A6A2115|nr:LacI family DNA-binding transcriptional regulator [Microbacterium sp. CFBP9034]MDY0908820.1 LacI family DNA-binding transcriptional regulator [Microbacterium sp. CFBP9034]
MSSSQPPAGRESRVTMKQVAALAGVGIKTVSRVLNNEPNVSVKTAERVHDAVRALDYQLDLQAGSLRRIDGRTRTLGLLVGSVDNPFSGAIHRAVEDAAVGRGIAVFASSLDDDPRREESAVRAFLQRRVDGLILTTARRRPDYVTSLGDRGIPAVFVDRRPIDVDLDSVTSDNREAAHRATTHLVARGHRRIALLADRSDLQTADERRQGFLDAVGRAGIPTTETVTVMDLHDANSAEAAVAALLSSDRPPTAIFSAQNLITVGAVHALRAAGAQRSIALIGFDDIPLADLLEPGVTVVAQDPYEIGRVAVEHVFSRLEGYAGPARHTVVPTTLIARGSGEIEPAR